MFESGTLTSVSPKAQGPVARPRSQFEVICRVRPLQGQEQATGTSLLNTDITISDDKPKITICESKKKLPKGVHLPPDLPGGHSPEGVYSGACQVHGTCPGYFRQRKPRFQLRGN